jgi:3-hydroxyisobutyrate dehydrogenase-like beta-hydroxyacid dehydrogenase
VIIGILHPGEMGSAIGDALVDGGHDVIWASAGRSEATRERAKRFRDVSSVDAIVAEAAVILSICPPHVALDVARGITGFGGVYVDANAISPAHARELESMQARFVDGGIIGPPPHGAGETRLYLSGPEATWVAGLFAGGIVDARVVVDASALKLTYAAWSKGTAALVLAIDEVAKHYGVGEALMAEWRESQPDLIDRLAAAQRSAAHKGWRWIGEMEEIADAFAAAGQPEGFHRAAAEVFRP